MSDLHQLLRWRLLKGSHKFPGPDGGTCINEAAVVVAGFPYRKVDGTGDLPKCFSRPLSAYAIRLNDSMSDELRQELLLPFVVRLAGTADTREIERERADLLVIRTVTTILPILLRLRQLDDIARLCEKATTRQEAHAAANKARDHLRDAAYTADAGYAADAAYTADAGYAADAASAAAYASAAPPSPVWLADAGYAAAAVAAYAAATAAASASATASAAVAAAVAAYAAYAEARLQIWTAATSILDAALKIGRQAEPIEAAIIVSRAEKAKRELARV